METNDRVTKEKGIETTTDNRTSILYRIDKTPPWYLCVMLGLQHYLTAFGACISIPILLSEFFCMDQDKVGISELIGTTFIVSGVSTLLQTTFGVRLPIVQGGTFIFVAPTIAILMQKKWNCPYREARATDLTLSNFTASHLPEVGSDAHREMWMERIREIQGTIMVASVFQVITGCSGLIGFILRFVGPLTIAPSVTLIGLSLFSTGSSMASQHWWIALTTVVLFTICSQYLNKVTFSCVEKCKGGSCSKIPVFGIFPILISVLVMWMVCAILTVTSVFPDNQQKHGYSARTDIGIDVVEKTHWFRFPYPGQWGVPTVSPSSVFGMLAGVFIAMIDTAGNYYACATFAGAPPPPTYAVNRGIFVQGICAILAGIWGSGSGSSLFSENIGVVAVTKVGSIRAVQVCGMISIIFGCVGKFNGLMAMIPTPIIGGILMVTFSIITAVGLSFLRHADLNSTRNIYILGSSIFFGLSISIWIEGNNDVINTGSATVDEVLTVLLSTGIFVAGFIGFVLDNTIPGTEEERGIKAWRKLGADDENASASLDIYHMPAIQKYLDSRFIPICPSFRKVKGLSNGNKKSDARNSNELSEVNVSENNGIWHL